VTSYLSTVAERLEDVLGGDLAGVYVGGSYALGDYLHRRSDLDMAAVVRSSLPPATKRRIVTEVREDAIHCPARKLELVVYHVQTARSGTPTPDFELDLNTGTNTPLHVDYDHRASQVGGHWFGIDRGILAQAGIALRGPPAHEVFAPIPPSALTGTLVESLRWHRERGTDPSDAVLNACRALRFRLEGRWTSKTAAGAWAAERRLAPPDLVAMAGRARTRDANVDRGEAARFLETVEARMRTGEAAALN
jgi:hypothetical protein